MCGTTIAMRPAWRRPGRPTMPIASVSTITKASSARCKTVATRVMATTRAAGVQRGVHGLWRRRAGRLRYDPAGRRLPGVRCAARGHGRPVRQYGATRIRVAALAGKRVYAGVHTRKPGRPGFVFDFDLAGD